MYRFRRSFSIFPRKEVPTIMDSVLSLLAQVGQIAAALLDALSQSELFQSFLSGAARFLLPLLAILVVVRCARSLFQDKLEQEVWGSLVLTDGESLPLTHWENLIGRSRRADVLLKFKTVSRSHAALIRDSGGNWVLYPLNSKNGVTVNGVPVLSPVPVEARDVLAFGGVETCFLPSTAEEERRQAQSRSRPGKEFSPSVTLLLLSLFQGLLCSRLWAVTDPDYQSAVTTCFGVLFLLMWGVYLFYRILHRTGFEVETLAFFLTTLCLAVTGSSAPSGLMKQTVCVGMGIVLFLALSFSLRSVEFSMRLRWPLACLTVALLAFNLLFGEKLFGAKNWLAIGSISFQPSEFVKIVFILVGATTLDRMFDRKNLWATLIYSAICVGCLGLMSDFGTALIFFVALLAITFLRSGDLASVVFMVAAALSGGYIILQFKSYIFARFAIYRHVWEDPSNLGYQQTRTMSAIADGGLFGRGIGNGWLKSLGAANTDLVFGVVAEELGLIMAVIAVIVILLLALFAVREASAARSSFYVITACSAAMIFVVQTMLNVFGSTDLLPLTGVTFPFLSVGGSSMVSCWALLAYIKASDTRQNAALAVRLPGRRSKDEEETDEPEQWEAATGFFNRTQEELPEETEEDNAPTVIRRPNHPPTPPAPPQGEQPPGATEEAQDFPDLSFDDSVVSDADNWRDYFLREDEWEDPK